ncbi:MAG: ABC transporter ATP-binding protein [Chloroflexota bacterium]
MITVSALSKRFKEANAVNAISFACRQGEIFGLLGENGAGKTTTLRMLATILRPTGGTATIAGHDLIREPAEVRRRIGFLTGDSGLYDRLTTREVLGFFGRMYDLPRQAIKSRTDELIAWLGMESFADRRTAQFSRGMKQKVSIARSLIHDPPVLLFDEPTAGLDVTSARAVDELILKARADGKTIILSSHIMSEVEKLCDRVAIIHRGEIIACDTIAALKANEKQTQLEDIFVRLVGEER